MASSSSVTENVSVALDARAVGAGRFELVEPRIGLRDRQIIVPGVRFGYRARHGLHLVKLTRRDAQRREPRDGLGDDHVRLEQLAHIQEIHLPDDKADAGPDIDQPLGREQKQGFANGGTTDRELRREVVVVEALAGSQLKADDPALDLAIRLHHRGAVCSGHCRKVSGGVWGRRGGSAAGERAARQF